MELHPAIFAAIQGLIGISVVLGIANYAVLAERKVSSFIQGRVGPNRTTLPVIGSFPIIGPFLTKLGFFQPVADGGKFLLKEEIIPGHVNKFYYHVAPLASLIPALTTMIVLPVGLLPSGNPVVIANIDLGILFLLAIGSLGVYGIILAGWAANSKYPFLGGIRSSAQMISYELAMTLSILPVFLWTGGTLNLANVVTEQGGIWLIMWQPLSALIFLIALFAETNRLPFDMPEAETELVGGYNTEYGAFKFGLFFVAEYAHIVIGSAAFTILFLGGWHLPFVDVFQWVGGIAGTLLSLAIFFAKVFFLIFFFMWIRWTLPRFRYDQVMNLGWKVLLPLSLANLLLYAVGIAVFESVF